MTINALKKLGGQKVEKGYSFGRKYSSFRVSCNSIGNNNERAEIAELLTNSFDVEGYSFNRHYFA
jgi:hypothetical protein